MRLISALLNPPLPASLTGSRKELGNVSVPLDVHEWRLLAVTGIERAAVGTISQHSGHSRTKDSINASSSALLDLRHILGIQQPV
jgi:hypothetical protein